MNCLFRFVNHFFFFFSDGSRSIDFAIANSEIPKKVEELPSLLKQVSCCILKLNADSGHANLDFDWISGSHSLLC